jgi:general secretion pathway protein D
MAVRSPFEGKLPCAFIDPAAATLYIMPVLRLSLSAVALCAAAGLASAQVPPPPAAAQSPGVPAVAQVPQNASAAPADAAMFEQRRGATPAVTPVRTPTQPPGLPGSVTTAPPPNGNENITLQFPNSDVLDVLRLYEQLTNKRLVIDNVVQGKVNIFVARPIPKEEAIKIIEINLLMNGYSLVPSEGDIIKVLGTGKNPRSAGIPIISDEQLIPSDGNIISFLFRLRFADPVELQAVLGQYLQPQQPYTSVLPLPKAGAILITENAHVIRTLVNIVSQIDIPPAEVVSEFIRLERADVSKVVEMLREVFDRGQQQGPAGPGGIRPVRPGMPPPVPGQPQQQQPVVYDGGDIGTLAGLTEDSIIVGKIKISADVRTNRIHVITRPVNMPFVKRLVAEFDANVEFAKPVTRPLRYISAADVLPVIVQTLQEPGADQAGMDPTGAVPGQPQQPRQPGRTANTADFNPGGFGQQTGGGLNVAEELSTQTVDTTPRAVTIGNAKIIADQRANTIIILGNREVVVKVQKLLDEMDVSSPQVMLSTVIGTLSLRNDEEFGVDYFQRFTSFRGGDQGAGGVLRNTGARIFDPGTLRDFTQVAAAAATGANVYINAAAGLSAIVRALDSTGRFRTISRPTVFTSNNKKAIIASGAEIPVPVSTITSGTGGVTGGLAQQSNIQFKKVALQLEVVPLINSEREVSLDILQKLDEVSGSTTIDNNAVPIIATRYIRTTVSAPNCATLVLGGLVRDNSGVEKSGLPILGRLPVVGGLFRNTRKEKSREELIILMRPEVSLTKLDSQRLRHRFQERTHFGPEIDQDDCPDCPPAYGDPKNLPAPDLPELPDVEYNQ